jgi:anti-anti-sigma factor
MEENQMANLHFLPNVERNGYERVITFTGRRNPGVGNPLASELEGRTDGLRKCQLLLDFGNVEFITGVELGTLITLHKKLRSCGARLTLVNLNAHVYEVFSITKLHTLFEIPREETFQLMEGLQNTLAWKVQGDKICRKLSSLKIITRSFQNHMECLMTTKEQDGYMENVLETHPNLSNAVEVLRLEHDEFREEMGLVLNRLDDISPSDQTCLTQICDKMTKLLKKLAGHNKNESDLFHEAFEREEGGEG